MHLLDFPTTSRACEKAGPVPDLLDASEMKIDLEQRVARLEQQVEDTLEWTQLQKEFAALRSDPTVRNDMEAYQHMIDKLSASPDPGRGSKTLESLSIDVSLYRSLV